MRLHSQALAQLDLENCAALREVSLPSRPAGGAQRAAAPPAGPKVGGRGGAGPGGVSPAERCRACAWPAASRLQRASKPGCHGVCLQGAAEPRLQLRGCTALAPAAKAQLRAALLGG